MHDRFVCMQTEALAFAFGSKGRKRLIKSWKGIEARPWLNSRANELSFFPDSKEMSICKAISPKYWHVAACPTLQIHQKKINTHLTPDLIRHQSHHYSLQGIVNSPWRHTEFHLQLETTVSFSVCGNMSSRYAALIWYSKPGNVYYRCVYQLIGRVHKKFTNSCMESSSLEST